MKTLHHPPSKQLIIGEDTFKLASSINGTDALSGTFYIEVRTLSERTRGSNRILEPQTKHAIKRILKFWGFNIRVRV